MRRPSGENTSFPIVPRVDSNRSGAVQSPEGPLRVALRRLRRSSEAHTARSPSLERLAEAGGLTSFSAGPDQLGGACATGGVVGGGAARATESIATPQTHSRNAIGARNDLAPAGECSMVRFLVRVLVSSDTAPRDIVRFRAPTAKLSRWSPSDLPAASITLSEITSSGHSPARSHRVPTSGYRTVA